ncbi:hypothetical protein TOT_030000153 [Theileria orientalis strain Shintoku]|uniref:Uncharacterized protein n=1 Tax=Theileria orientalis strain Shintoku TaxID=869250 RepID=J4CDC3_THEOR|nr:hypothetical protein TOT_030000153 [Theileria orientalis strain Shintoku]BAM40892.1 hypothetical protein TOT_030000153 [Theileria orientalis strain Shintoku]|eukprot:XP_009691193.1 hypothetical protein TOT_030000153 [Theileria orientalis strain Shintoku]
MFGRKVEPYLWREWGGYTLCYTEAHLRLLLSIRVNYSSICLFFLDSTLNTGYGFLFSTYASHPAFPIHARCILAKCALNSGRKQSRNQIQALKLTKSRIAKLIRALGCVLNVLHHAPVTISKLDKKSILNRRHVD